MVEEKPKSRTKLIITIVSAVFAILLVGCVIFSTVFYLVFTRAKNTAQFKQCQVNLRTIETGIAAYYADKGKYPKTISVLYPDYLNKADVDKCPINKGAFYLTYSGAKPIAKCPHGHTANSAL